MQANFIQRHPGVRDAFGLIVFIICVVIGTVFINSFIFRTFSVVGPSMESTMYTGDRLIVNRLPVTKANIQNKEYVPERGQVIVFINPNYTVGSGDEYIVKRVIAFPGERVTVKKGVLTVYNDKNPDGFHPDEQPHGEDGPGSPSSGNVDTVVPNNELFVAGDHREGNYSLDSRSGLGTIPFYDVIGPVGLRIWPLNEMRTF